MFRTISYKDLPNADLGTVGEIPLHFLFPVEAVYLSDVPAYIHYNGSLIRFFKTTGIDEEKICQAYRFLNDGTSFQIFKYHTPGKDSYYISLCQSINYRDSIPCSIFDNFSFNPIKKQIATIRDRVNEAYSSSQAFLADLNFEEIDYLQSDYPSLLFDFIKSGNTVQAIPVRTNMSFLRTGISRYATTASINNVSSIPQVRNILNDHTYLERIVVVVPSGERIRELHSHITDNAVLIEHLSNNFKSDVSIDTICKDARDLFPSYGRVVYTDVTFFLTSESVSSLCAAFQRFHDVMTENDIALYCHTNTTRSTFISFVPGNDSYGERYSLIFEHTLKNLIKNALGL